jgi:hypothetical protein
LILRLPGENRDKKVFIDGDVTHAFEDYICIESMPKGIELIFNAEKYF